MSALFLAAWLAFSGSGGACWDEDVSPPKRYDELIELECDGPRYLDAKLWDLGNGLVLVDKSKEV